MVMITMVRIWRDGRGTIYQRTFEWAKEKKQDAKWLQCGDCVIVEVCYSGGAL